MRAASPGATAAQGLSPRCRPVLGELDRDLRVLQPAAQAARLVLPNDFFDITAADVRGQQGDRSADATRELTLRTQCAPCPRSPRRRAGPTPPRRHRRAMRDAERRPRRHYKFAAIRVRHPEGLVLQGTFRVSERIGAVAEFVQAALADQACTFALHAQPGGTVLGDFEQTLADAQLVPAGLLNLHIVSGDGAIRAEVAAMAQP